MSGEDGKKGVARLRWRVVIASTMPTMNDPEEGKLLQICWGRGRESIDQVSPFI